MGMNEGRSVRSKAAGRNLAAKRKNKKRAARSQFTFLFLLIEAAVLAGFCLYAGEVVASVSRTATGVWSGIALAVLAVAFLLWHSGADILFSVSSVAKTIESLRNHSKTAAREDKNRRRQLDNNYAAKASISILAVGPATVIVWLALVAALKAYTQPINTLPIEITPTDRTREAFSRLAPVGLPWWASESAHFADPMPSAAPAGPWPPAVVPVKSDAQSIIRPLGPGRIREAMPKPPRAVEPESRSNH
jgi:hypothetical protein